MRYAIRKAKQGFTLIELMIVVAIVGILAVLAIYGVRKYLANAKTAEARNSLGQIGKDAATAFEKESMLGSVLTPGNSATLSRSLCGTQVSPGSIPSGIAAVAGKKYQSTAAEWNSDAATNPPAGFACLHFQMDAPQYYMYSYTGTTGGAAGSTFLATANGDLNGDTTTSTFTIAGTVSAAFILNIAPNITELSPDE